MKKEFSVNKAKFVYTKNELGYQEVLDDFENASDITIVTFNISEKQTYLINCLKKISDKAEIEIITNIPNRWEMYYKSNFREIAKKKISVYMTKLKAEEIGGKVSVFFNFDNHGKIIMTNNVAYIGSSNYSEESKNNSEFGFIVQDKEFIQYLKNEVISDVEKSALPYYAYNYTTLLLEANMAISALFSLRNELYEQIYIWFDDFYGQGYYYNTENDTLDINTLESIQSLIREINQISSEIYDALNCIANEDETVMNRMNDYYEEMLELSNTYEDLISSEAVFELANFNQSEFTNELIEGEYALEEDLDYCVDEAMSEANSKLHDLCNIAHENLDKIIEITDKYMDKMKKSLELFQQHDLVKVNPDIDNT